MVRLGECLAMTELRGHLDSDDIDGDDDDYDDDVDEVDGVDVDIVDVDDNVDEVDDDVAADLVDDTDSGHAAGV